MKEYAHTYLLIFICQFLLHFRPSCSPPAKNPTRPGITSSMAMDLENPDCVTRYVIRRIDPAVFYWIFCCFRQVDINITFGGSP